MFPPTRLSRRQDGQLVPQRVRAGPNKESSPPSSIRADSSTPSSPTSSSSTSLQTSPPSAKPAATTSNTITTSSSSSPPTSSPETSSSVPSATPAPAEQSSSPTLVPPPSDQTITVTSSVNRAQSSQSSSQAPSQSSHTSFLQNKPAMIAVFSIAGVVALVLIILLGTTVVRRRRRSRLIKEAIDFSPTTAHLVDAYDDSGRSDNDDEKIASLRSINDNTSRRARAPVSPALISPPVPVPSFREAQQQGTGTGYAGSGISYEYDSSSDPYYDTGRPQWQQQPQQQQRLVPSTPQQQPQWRQPQAEWPQQQDFQSGSLRHPSALVPAHHQVATQSQVPFARPARASPPPGVAGGMRGLGMSQNEYVQAPSQAALNTPGTIRRGGGNSGALDSQAGQDFGRTRILKVVNNDYY